MWPLRLEISPLLPVHHCPVCAKLLPGTFEHAVSVLVDHEPDLSPFIEAYRNDTTGAPAYHPAVLLKVILFGYSRGVISSRAIAAACCQHVQFMVPSGDSQPDFSTIAGFVSRHGEAIQSLFTQALVICAREELIESPRVSRRTPGLSQADLADFCSGPPSASRIGHVALTGYHRLAAKLPCGSVRSAQTKDAKRHHDSQAYGQRRHRGGRHRCRS